MSGSAYCPGRTGLLLITGVLTVHSSSFPSRVMVSVLSFERSTEDPFTKSTPSSFREAASTFIDNVNGILVRSVPFLT